MAAAEKGIFRLTAQEHARTQGNLAAAQSRYVICRYSPTRYI